jgi:long-chain acyl-CoA synthetase
MSSPVHAYSVGSIAREHKRSFPSKTALVCEDVRLDYPQLDDRANRLASVMRSRGFSPGDRLLWLGQSCHRLIEAMIAAAKLGGMLCPINWRQSAEETAATIRDLDPAVVLHQAQEIGAMIQKARAIDPGRGAWIQHDAPRIDADGYEALLESAQAVDPDIAVDPSSPFLVFYTAAFDGSPLGAMISHEAMLLQGLVTSKLRRIDSDYVYLCSGPLFHLATFVVCFSTLSCGGTNVMVRRVEATELCRLIDRERCTGAFLMPPTMAEMVEANRSDAWSLKSLRSYPGTPQWNRMVTLDDSPAARRPGGYGQTEVSGHLSFGALGIEGTGSSGRPMPGVEVRIVDPEGRELGAGEVGEIVARGPSIMCGYWNHPQETRARFRDGWHHTRDLGQREADGTLSFIGPMTRLIKSAAENIYPAEVEACIKQHASVRDCAVIGVPDPTWGQSVRAIVVLKSDSAASEEEIIAHAKSRIASYKKPRSVVFVGAIPRRGHAIDYDALDAEHGGGGYPSGRTR